MRQNATTVIDVPMKGKAPAGVLELDDVELAEIATLLARFGLRLELVAPGESIPGTYWGEPEAGLVEATLYARGDTPVHSVLHEASHFVCMGRARRERLHRDAGGDDEEESAVCYLQVLLSARVPGVGRERMFHDMDAWGYSFRLGGSRKWFEEDAADARAWLLARGIVNEEEEPRWPDTT